jgi:FeS assembly SUF system protein
MRWLIRLLAVDIRHQAIQKNPLRGGVRGRFCRPKIQDKRQKSKEREMDANEQLEIETRIIGVLKSIFDPEIPVNIYDLGLIYNIDLDDDHIAHVTMTLTAPNCPMAEQLIEEVKYKVGGTKGVKDIDLKLTFSPRWDKSMLSDEAKLELGFL